jgi:hypothetical protein
MAMHGAAGGAVTDGHDLTLQANSALCATGSATMLPRAAEG